MNDEKTHPEDGPTILLVEDKVLLLMMTSELLREFGYTVIPMGSGEDAMNVVDDHTAFDLLLTDISMPGKIDGFELARRLLAARPGVPILFMTGYAGLAEAQKDEFDAPVLQKPVAPDVLAKAISGALCPA